MTPAPYLPVSFGLTFALDTERGRYVVVECEPGFTRVPRELVVEDKRYNNAINANLLLQGTKTHKKTGGRSVDFFTGLLPTAHRGVFLGNVLTFGRGGERVRNGVVVRFSEDAARLTLRYVPAYYPYPEHRAAFVAEVVRRGLI